MVNFRFTYSVSDPLLASHMPSLAMKIKAPPRVTNNAETIISTGHLPPNFFHHLCISHNQLPPDTVQKSASCNQIAHFAKETVILSWWSLFRPRLATESI
jgi:hypothetical protein